MERDELFDKLKGLAQMDYDAVRVYDEALEHVKDADVQRQFELFRGEHKVHAEQLTREIARLGGNPPELRVDLMGHVVDWVTSIRSIRGTEGAVHAMRTAERYHNKRYNDAVTWDVGDEALARTLREYLDDERAHLAFVESRIHAGAARE